MLNPKQSKPVEIVPPQSCQSIPVNFKISLEGVWTFLPERFANYSRPKKCWSAKSWKWRTCIDFDRSDWVLSANVLVVVRLKRPEIESLSSFFRIIWMLFLQRFPAVNCSSKIIMQNHLTDECILRARSCKLLQELNLRSSGERKKEWSKSLSSTKVWRIYEQAAIKSSEQRHSE